MNQQQLVATEPMTTAPRRICRHGELGAGPREPTVSNAAVFEWAGQRRRGRRRTTLVGDPRRQSPADPLTVTTAKLQSIVITEHSEIAKVDHSGNSSSVAS